MAKARFWVAGAALALLAVGCTKPMDITKTDGSFTDSQRLYTKLVRWGEIERASVFVVPELREEFMALEPGFDEVRFTDYEVGLVQPGEEEGTAIVTVTYQVYSMSTLIQHTLTEKQVWKKDGWREGWHVEPGLEGFRSVITAAR